RLSKAAPSRYELHELIELERDFLVGMCLAQRVDDLVRDRRWDDGLDAQLGDSLLRADPADRRVRALACEERPGAGRVPRAALVPPDAPRAPHEHGCPCRGERPPSQQPNQLAETQD